MADANELERALAVATAALRYCADGVFREEEGLVSVIAGRAAVARKALREIADICAATPSNQADRP